MAHDAFSPLGRRDFLELALGGMALGLIAASPFAALAQAAAGGARLKIGTIGAGREGGALGTLFARHGHPVMFSSRNPEQLKELVASAGPHAQAGTVEQAVAFGDVIFLVVPYTAVEQIGKQHGKALAEKRLVLDVSNPIARRDGEDIVKWANDQGGAGLATQKLLPGAHLVRAFNAIGSGRLADDSERKGDPVGVPIAGDDQAAVELASSLIKQVGFEPVLVGGLAMGKYLVPGTPLAGEHSPAEIREIAENLH
ncbi:MAG TPA: NADPH-dependent F420 reductase [Stellaceae bacterium]|nr:NADPH-dependent F420 reductase [Stellaceae bacterium]